MGKVSNIACRSWDEFKTTVVAQLFRGSPFQKSRFLFRGQLDPSWKLTSSFDRWFDELRADEARRIETANQLLETFKREMANAGHNQLMGLPEEQVMALAQHYGLPTRLLDWSESPYIAAFFAFVDVIISRREPECVAVWALDTKCYCWQKGWGSEIISIAAPGSNARLRNQEGKFTLLSSQSKSLNEFLEHFQGVDDREPPLQCFLIPARDFQAALAELDAMGINSARAFSDLQGYAMAARVQQQLRMQTQR